MVEELVISICYIDITSNLSAVYPCAAADVVAEAPALNGPSGKRVDVHEAADTTATVSNANLDVIMEAAAATCVPTSDRPAGVPAAAPGSEALTFHHNCRG